MNERELRASLLAVGPLLPVLIYQGHVLDGRKRDSLCSELGLASRTQILTSITEACSALWLMHPERALELARSEQITTLGELARVCTARASDVAAMLRANKRDARERSPRRARGQKSVLVQFWADPQWKHFMKRAGEDAHLDLSTAIRVAGWEFVKQRLPRAAREGSERGPVLELARRARRSNVGRTP